MSPRLAFSAVLGSFNRAHLLPHAIESIRRESEGIPLEIIVVDGVLRMVRWNG